MSDSATRKTLPVKTVDVEAATAKKDAGEEWKRPISTGQWIMVVAGLCLGAMLYGLDTSITADVQSPVLESLGEIEKLPWIGIGFPMGSVAVILLLGKCYELFEIKYLLIGSLVLFEVGSALCGAALNMNMMIIGRIIAGAGGAGMYLGALTYFSVFTNMKERSLYNAGMGMAWGIGVILGPLIGGGLSVSNATWRWAFYINLPLAGLFSPIYIFSFPKYSAKSEVATLEKLKKLDWVGATLNAMLFVVLQIVSTLGGTIWNWSSAGPIACWIVFGILTIIFGVQQSLCLFTSPESRIFPVQFLKRRSMVLLYIAQACSSTSMFVCTYYIPLFFAFTKGDSAIEAAVRLLPFVAIAIFFVMLAGGLLPVVGRYQPLYIISGVFMTIGACLMYTVNAETSISAIYGYEVLLATGTGLSLQSGYGVAAAKAKGPAEVQSSIGFMNVAQIGTIAISLSIAGSLFQNLGFSSIKSALEGYGFADDQLRSMLGGAASPILIEDPAVRNLAVGAVVATISKIWIMTIVAGAVMVVAGLLMKREKLDMEPTDAE